MKRVLIIGSAGSGKSTLARRLGAMLSLPVIHLDAHFWRAGWKEPPRDEWRAKVAELVLQDEWVMDGNYSSTLSERIDRADTVILLDIPRVQCVYRVVMRGLRERGKARSDLHPGCAEQFPEWSFIREIWRFPETDLLRIRTMLKQHKDTKDIVVLRSTSEVQAYASGVAAL